MTQQADTQQARPKTVHDLANEIALEAGIEGIEVPGIPKAVWFRGPWSATAEGTDIRHGSPLPMNPMLVVFRMFEDAGEIRVYCLSLSKSPTEKGDDAPPSCYKLNKASPVYTAHSMSLSLFRDEVAGELRRLAGFDDEIEDDEVTCPACGIDVPELPYCGSCGVKLPETPDEETAATVPAATNGAAAVAS